MNIKLSTLFISIIGAIVFITTTNATTMCVTDDMEQVILDPSVGSESSSTPTSTTWQVNFPYGTVSGIATCNSISGSWGKAYSGNNNDIKQGTEGVYCWCRMTSPVRSAWVYADERSSASECASNCARNCGSTVQNNSNFRRSFFDSAGM